MKLLRFGPTGQRALTSQPEATPQVASPAPQFALKGQYKTDLWNPASGIASAIRVSAIFRDGQVMENRQRLTRRADAQPLAGSAYLGRRSSTFVDSLAPG